MLIVRKSINMAKQLNIPIAGLVENMSYMKCPHCSERIQMFQDSHIEAAAKGMQIPFLGKLPFDPEVNNLADQGRIENYSSPETSQLVREVRTRMVQLGGITAQPIAWKRSSGSS